MIDAKTRAQHLVEDFLRVKNFTDRKLSIDGALDVLYDRMNEALVKGDLEFLNATVEIDPSIDPHLTIGILTCTLPVKNRLPSRSEFFGKSEQVLKGCAIWEPGLLTGLE